MPYASAPASSEPAALVALLSYGRLDNPLFRAGIGLLEDTIGWEALSGRLLSLSAMGFEAVFPSHFFEYPGADRVLGAARDRGVRCYLQVSLGSEFRDVFERLKAIAGQDVGIEAIFDRAPDPVQWTQLEELSAMGVRVRFVYCPTRDFLPTRVLESLTPGILARTRFYFAPKAREDDEFLGADEIYLLLREISERFPGVVPRAAAHLCSAENPRVRDGAIDEESASRAFRSSLDPAVYRLHFVAVGRARGVRGLVAFMARSRFLAAILHLPYWLAALIRSPAQALRQAVVVSYWRAFPLFARLRGEAIRIFLFVRGRTKIVAIGLYWRVYQGLSFLRDHAIGLYWRTYGGWSCLRGNSIRIFLFVRGWTKILAIRLYWLIYHGWSCLRGHAIRLAWFVGGLTKAWVIRLYWAGVRAGSALMILVLRGFWKARGALIWGIGLMRGQGIRLYWLARRGLSAMHQLVLQAFWLARGGIIWSVGMARGRATRVYWGIRREMTRARGAAIQGGWLARGGAIWIMGWIRGRAIRSRWAILRVLTSFELRAIQGYWLARRGLSALHQFALRAFWLTRGGIIWSVGMARGRATRVYWGIRREVTRARGAAIQGGWLARGGAIWIMGWIRGRAIRSRWAILRVLTSLELRAIQGYWLARRGLSAMHRFALRAFWLVRGRIIWSIGMTRGRAIRVYWVARRAISTLQLAWIHAGWFFWGRGRRLLSYFLHPAHLIRVHLPPVYWIFFHPVLKAYWFTRYQLETRILARTSLPRPRF